MSGIQRACRIAEGIKITQSRISCVRENLKFKSGHFMSCMGPCFLPQCKLLWHEMLEGV